MQYNNELDGISRELGLDADSVVREHHNDLARDHDHLEDATLHTAANVNAQPGSMTYVALSDPAVQSPLDVLNYGTTCSTNATSSGDGPFRVDTFTLQRGRYQQAGKPPVATDVTGGVTAEGSGFGDTPVVEGTVAFAFVDRNSVDTNSSEFTAFLQGLEFEAPTAAAGTATLYTLVTVSAFECSVNSACQYTATDGEGYFVYHDWTPADDVLEYLEPDTPFAQFVTGLQPLQAAVHDAVKAATSSTPELP